MSNNPSPNIEINAPGQYRIALIGAAVCAAGMTWIAAVASAPTVAAGDAPQEIFLCLLAGAVALTLGSLQLGISYVSQRISADNQRSIAIAVGALAAEVEQVGEQVRKIDHWSIYTAVYEDLLMDRKN